MNLRNKSVVFVLIMMNRLIISTCENNTERENLVKINESDLNFATRFSQVDFATNFLLADVIRFLPLDDVTQQCFVDLKVLKLAIDNRSIWAMKALESSAMLPNNFIYGNNIWLGSRFECDAISNPKEVKVSKSFYKKVNQHIMQRPTIVMSYKIIYATIYSPMQVDVRYFDNETLHLGLCLPQSCRGDVLVNISETYFSRDDAIIKVMYNLTSQNVGVKDLVLSEHFYRKLSLLLLGIILIPTLILVIVSEILSRRLESDVKVKSYSFVLQAFSLRKNLNTVFSSTEVAFPEINGLRYISSCFVLTFHVEYFNLYKLSSKWMGLVYAEDFKYQILNRGTIFVDAFFVISGFLLIHSYLKHENQTNCLSSNSCWLNSRFLTFVTFKRIIRIVPLYVVILLLTEITSSYLRETSTILLHENDDYNCQKYWWRNLLFIQNLFPHKDSCMNWSWTLACEMQYFSVCNLIYITYCKRKVIGKLFYAFTVVLILATSVYLLIKNKFVPTNDVMLTTLDDLYVSPFARSPPYFIGAGIAYFVAKGKLKISEFWAKIFWLVTIAFLCAVISLPVDPDLPLWFFVSSFVVGKWMMSLCFCWLFLSSILGHKNFFTNCLSHPILNHFGKISFAFYLLNPLLLIILFGTSEYAAEVDPLVQMVFAVGVCSINYVFAVIFTIVFEMPYQKLFNNFTK